MRIDVWSDIACPWCYIGKRHLEQALAKWPHPVELTWHSFELDPNAPPSHPGDHASMLAAKFGLPREQADRMLADMTATAARDGLEYHFDIAQSGNTFDAHRLLHLAEEHGVQDAMKERLMAANFTEGRLVSDAETLVELGVSVGLDEAEVRATVSGDAYALAVRADEEQARRLGITGVPFFVFDGKYGISGAQPASSLRQMLDKAWVEAGSAAPEPAATSG